MCLLLVSLAVTGSALASDSPSARHIQKILFIVETVSGADTATWKDSAANTSSLLTTQYYLGNNGVSDTIFPSASGALNAFATLDVSDYVTEVSGYMKLNGYAYARVDWFYNFTDAGDSNTPKQVYLPLLVYPDGNVRNMGMRVITVAPRVLWFQYYSLSSDSTLPAGWAQPKAGILDEYVLDQSLTITIKSMQVPVVPPGAYDPPPPGTGVDPDQGLELLVKNVVVPEMTNYGAVYAIVDYSRSLQAQYDCYINNKPTGTTCDTSPCSGDCIARVSVNSTARTDYTNQCELPVTTTDPITGDTTTTYTLLWTNQTYENKGFTGYTVVYQADRYIVDPSGNKQYTATSKGTMMNPFSAPTFDKTIPLPSGNLGNIIIDPFWTSSFYDFTNDPVNFLPSDHYVYGTPTGQPGMQAPITKANNTYYCPGCPVNQTSACSASCTDDLGNPTSCDGLVVSYGSDCSISLSCATFFGARGVGAGGSATCVDITNHWTTTTISNTSAVAGTNGCPAPPPPPSDPSGSDG
jgi:hypothetical protein